MKRDFVYIFFYCYFSILCSIQGKLIFFGANISHNYNKKQSSTKFLLSFTFKFPLLPRSSLLTFFVFLLLLTTGVQSTSSSFAYFTPSPHSKSLPPQNHSPPKRSISLCIFIFFKLSSTACRFPSMGAAFGGDHALVCSNWCTRCRRSCTTWGFFLMSLFLIKEVTFLFFLLWLWQSKP